MIIINRWNHFRYISLSISLYTKTYTLSLYVYYTGVQPPCANLANIICSIQLNWPPVLFGIFYLIIIHIYQWSIIIIFIFMILFLIIIIIISISISIITISITIIITIIPNPLTPFSFFCCSTLITLPILTSAPTTQLIILIDNTGMPCTSANTLNCWSIMLIQL